MIKITPIAGRKVLSLDIATATGICWTDGTRHIVRSWKLTKNNQGQAIIDLQRELRGIIVELGCTLVVFEDASFGASRQMRTMAFHNALRGAIESVCTMLDLQFWKYAPTSIKKHIAGNGRADKEQVRRAVERLFGIVTANDNESDAAAMAMLAVQDIKPVSMVKRAAKKRIKQAKKLERKLF